MIRKYWYKHELVGLLDEAVARQDWAMVENLSYILRIQIEGNSAERTFWPVKLHVEDYGRTKLIIYDELRTIMSQLTDEQKADGWFESRGQAVSNPFMDESLRFNVEPFDYYGRETIIELVNKHYEFN